VAHANFKRASSRLGARRGASVQLDARFPVIPVRALANDGTRNFMDKQRSVIERFNKGELDQKAAQLEMSGSGPARCGAR